MQIAKRKMRILPTIREHMGNRIPVEQNIHLRRQFLGADLARKRWGIQIQPRENACANGDGSKDQTDRECGNPPYCSQLSPEMWRQISIGIVYRFLQANGRDFGMNESGARHHDVRVEHAQNFSPSPCPESLKPAGSTGVGP